MAAQHDNLFGFVNLMFTLTDEGFRDKSREEVNDMAEAYGEDPIRFVSDEHLKASWDLYDDLADKCQVKLYDFEAGMYEEEFD